MFSDAQLEQLLRIFQRRMQALLDAYLQSMGEHLRDIGRLLPSDVNRLTELRRINTNISHIKREIAKAAGQNIQDIEKVFTAVAASDYAFMEQYYGSASRQPFLKNKAILRILQAQYNVTAQEMRNLSQTTILSAAYRSAVDVAIQAAQAGVVDYNTTIRSAMKAAAQEGLRVRYPNSGLTRRLDTAVRMNVLDGIRSLNNDVLQQTGEEFGADGIELSAHALCAEDHLPYQGRQYSMAQFEEIQQRLRRPIGMWNCKHTRHPIILGVSEPAYSPEQLEKLRRNSSAQITIDGVTKSRYEWTQEQRRIETAIRYQDDVVTMASAIGDNTAVSEARGNIKRLISQYDHISDSAGLETRYERTVGYGGVKPQTTKSLKAIRKSDILITSKQFGSKAGKHMREWNLDPTVSDDRAEFERITRNVVDYADEVRLVQWQKDPDTGKRTVEVYAYIRGNDVVLVDRAGNYITTMKNGSVNKRVMNGRKV